MVIEVLRWLVDAVIALTLIEALVLWLYHRRSGRGLALSEIGLNLFSGLCLMLALRVALAGDSLWLVAAALAAAGILHALDIRRRWRR
jgi:hypothetical protein